MLFAVLPCQQSISAMIVPVVPVDVTTSWKLLAKYEPERVVVLATAPVVAMV